MSTTVSNSTQIFGVIFLTDALGLGLVHGKLTVEKSLLAILIWIPDLSDGRNVHEQLKPPESPEQRLVSRKLISNGKYMFPAEKTLPHYRGPWESDPAAYMTFCFLADFNRCANIKYSHTLLTHVYTTESTILGPKYNCLSPIQPGARSLVRSTLSDRTTYNATLGCVRLHLLD